MELQKITLKNNLEVLFIDCPGSTVASVQAWFKAGSALEKKGEQGIAHFLEHMFFKGSKKFSGQKIATTIENIGGELNAFTSFDYTCYYVNIPNSHLMSSAKMLLEMISTPAFAENHITPEKDVVIEELKRSLDHPSQYAFFEMQKNCFSVGYDHSILGSINTINQFSTNKLKKFLKEYYSLSNMLLIVSGELTQKKKIISLIEKYQFPPGLKNTFPPFTIKSKNLISIHHKDVRTAQVNILIQGPEFISPSSAAEDLAFSCIAHGESSRLHKEIVLTGTLANSCSSSTMFFCNGSMHHIRITCPPENLSKIIKKIKRIFIDIQVNGFEKWEIERIKNQYASSKIYDRESLESFSFSLGHSFAQTGNIFGEDEFINRIKKTTTTSVNDAINDIFKRNVSIVAQIPRAWPTLKFKKELHTFLDNHKILQQKAKRKSSLIHKSASKFDPNVKLLNLMPGVQLLHRYNDITPTFVLHSYQKGGLIEENYSTNGTYNLLSTLLTRGFSGIPYNDIKMQLENKSATFQSFCGKNAYGITMHGQSEHFNELSNIFTNSLINSDMSDEFLEHEKKIILRSLENQLEDPVRLCFKKVSELMFNNHPYALNILGNASSIPSISRNVLLKSHQDNLHKKQLLFTFCGDIVTEEVAHLLVSNLNTLKARPTTSNQSVPYSPATNKYHFIPLDREQTQIFIGFPCKGINSSDNLYLKILTSFLSGQGSKLFVQIRDKLGLCYAIQPMHFQALDGGYWGIYMACGHDKVSVAINKINEILIELQQKGINDKAYLASKTMIKGQGLLNIQTNEDYANLYSIPHFYGLGIDHFYKKNNAIESLNYEQFQLKIKKILASPLYTVIVGKNK